jgi:hypothetical protein
MKRHIKIHLNLNTNRVSVEYRGPVKGMKRFVRKQVEKAINKVSV